MGRNLEILFSFPPARRFRRTIPFWKFWRFHWADDSLLLNTPVFSIKLSYWSKCWDRYAKEGGVSIYLWPVAWNVEEGEIFYRFHWESMIYASEESWRAKRRSA